MASQYKAVLFDLGGVTVEWKEPQNLLNILTVGRHSYSATASRYRSKALITSASNREAPNLITLAHKPGNEKLARCFMDWEIGLFSWEEFISVSQGMVEPPIFTDVKDTLEKLAYTEVCSFSSVLH